MPTPAIKFTVLALSLGLGVAYVWKSARGNRPAEPPPHPAPKTAVASENPVTVSDEEVAKQREMLLGSSKSGLIMSDTDIRKMLEEMKRAKLPKEGVQDPTNLIPSSKSSAVFNPAELKDLQPLLPPFRQGESTPPKEESNEPPPAPQNLIPSSKSAPIFRHPEEVKNAVESIVGPSPAKKE